MITTYKEFIEIESKKDYYIKLKEFVINDIYEVNDSIIKKLKCQKVLLHYGKSSIKELGLYDRIVASLNKEGIDFIVSLSKLKINSYLGIFNLLPANLKNHKQTITPTPMHNPYMFKYSIPNNLGYIKTSYYHIFIIYHILL